MNLDRRKRDSVNANEPGHHVAERMSNPQDGNSSDSLTNTPRRCCRLQRRWMWSGAITASLLAMLFIGWNLLHLPHPEHSSSSQLMRWLVQRDLADQPEEIQLSIVNRIVEETDIDENSMLPEGDAPRLSPSQSDRLAKNTELLKRVWFFDRARRYESLSEDRQFSFLERQITVIERLLLLTARYGEWFGWGVSPDDSWIDQIDTWFAHASPGEQPMVSRVLRDGLICWLATRDLADKSMLMRRTLARRIASELENGSGLSRSLPWLDQPQQKRLFSNSELLFEAWIYWQLEEFVTLNAEDRERFVTTRVDQVRRWGILPLLGHSTSDGQWGELAGAMRLSSLFEEWIQRANEPRKSQLEDLHEAVMDEIYTPQPN